MKKKIKKTMLGIFAAGMVLFIGTAMAFAGSHQGWRTPQKYRK